MITSVGIIFLKHAKTYKCNYKYISIIMQKYLVFCHLIRKWFFFAPIMLDKTRSCKSSNRGWLKQLMYQKDKPALYRLVNTFSLKAPSKMLRALNGLLLIKQGQHMGEACRICASQKYHTWTWFRSCLPVRLIYSPVCYVVSSSCLHNPHKSNLGIRVWPKDTCVQVQPRPQLK